MISRRFQHLFEQVISSTFSGVKIDESVVPINKLSLILPEENEEIQRTVFYRLPNVDNEGIVIPMLNELMLQSLILKWLIGES
jgi:hypothetical protein